MKIISKEEYLLRESVVKVVKGFLFLFYCLFLGVLIKHSSESLMWVGDIIDYAILLFTILLFIFSRLIKKKFKTYIMEEQNGVHKQT